MSDLLLTRVVDAENPTVHDLRLVNGQIQWVGIDLYDADEQAAMIAQRIACRILWIKGEWYLDQKQGTPWLQALWAKGTSVLRAERILRRIITETPGVAAVTAMTITHDPITRISAVTFTARADTGAQIGPATLDLPFVVRET